MAITAHYVDLWNDKTIFQTYDPVKKRWSKRTFDWSFIEKSSGRMAPPPTVKVGAWYESCGAVFKIQDITPSGAVTSDGKTISYYTEARKITKAEAKKIQSS